VTLGEVASTLLAAFSEQLTQQDIKVPDRAYVAPGNIIPWDGEQLVVVLQSIGQGSPGKPNPGTYVPGSEILMATFAVALVREIPVLSGEGFVSTMIPEAVELGEAGVAGVEDASALMTAAIDVHKIHAVTEGGLMGFAIGPCLPLGPEGGLAGPKLTIEVNTDG
jgi:hypothetical protein